MGLYTDSPGFRSKFYPVSSQQLGKLTASWAAHLGWPHPHPEAVPGPRELGQVRASQWGPGAHMSIIFTLFFSLPLPSSLSPLFSGRTAPIKSSGDF